MLLAQINRDLGKWEYAPPASCQCKAVCESEPAEHSQMHAACEQGRVNRGWYEPRVSSRCEGCTCASRQGQVCAA